MLRHNLLGPAPAVKEIRQGGAGGLGNTCFSTPPPRPARGARGPPETNVCVALGGRDVSIAGQGCKGLQMARLHTTELRVATRKTPRAINRQIVLNLLRSQQPVSRAELARLLGIQRS